MCEDAARRRSCSIIFPSKLESKVVYGPLVEAIGGFPETGVNSREHPGQVWGCKRWRAGHTGDITGFCGSAAE